MERRHYHTATQKGCLQQLERNNPLSIPDKVFCSMLFNRLKTHGVTDMFDILTGVRQGCVLSPFLFSRTLQCNATFGYCHEMSSVVCLSSCLSWPNGWTDQDETWHAGRPRPWPHCVRWEPSSPSPNGA